MIEISPQEKLIIREILNEYIPGRKVMAFGSRVNGTNKDYSDLDLAIMEEKPIDLKTMALLKDAFGESDLPFRIDILEWRTTSPEFKKVIEPQLQPIM